MALYLKPGVYGGTVIPQDREGYVALAPVQRFSRWFCVRLRDCKVMTEAGDPAAAAKAIQVWGPMWDLHR